MAFTPIKICAVFLAIFLCFSSLVALAFGTSSGVVAALPASQTAMITANLSSSSFTIPANFNGYSDELADAITDTIFKPSNTSLIGLIKLLGPAGYIRFGGNSQEQYAGHYPVLTQPIANDVAGFVAALGSNWTFSWGLSLQADSTALAISTSGYINTAINGSQPLILEISNEPDDWTTASNFISLWNTYYAALSVAYPSAVYVAPSVANSYALPTYMPGLTLSPSQFYYLSYHYYYSNGSPPLSAAQLTSIAPSTVISTAAANYRAGNQLRLEEFGPTYANNGSQNYANLGSINKLAQATYYLQMAIQTASLGYVGVNPHNILTTASTQDIANYNSFYEDSNNLWVPYPLFYGEYLFSKITGLQIVNTTTTNLDPLASAIAVKQTNGNAAILVSNADTKANVAFVPDQSSAWTTANLWILSGNTCFDVSPNINGAIIGESGAFTGTPTSIARGIPITIPPCGAALVQIQH